MKPKVGILGSRNLSYELTKWIVNQKKVEIIGIVPPSFNGWWNDELSNIAKENNLPIYPDIDTLLNNKPDILFSFNYWKKIEKRQIDAVPLGIINIHHSYLLKYKGRYSTSWAIINARKLNCWVHGTTLYYIVNEKLDEGKIIASYKCPITEDDTAETLFNRVEKLAVQMFKDYFDPIINNSIHDFLDPDPEPFYYDKDSNKNLEIKYGVPIEELYDLVRAWTFKDRPKPYFIIKGKKISLKFE